MMHLGKKTLDWRYILARTYQKEKPFLIKMVSVPFFELPSSGWDRVGPLGHKKNCGQRPPCITKIKMAIK